MSHPSTPDRPRDPGVPAACGPYTLGRKLGEGGFGAVYEAEQEHPVRRRVALKLIKLGMDTQDVIARFELERTALSMMDHPNIARVLDAGATESGRPYFVMELVEGEPISSYCDRHQLPIVDRLRLFEQVCAAVQHAHTKGIIHRDLKPSNVLVRTQDEAPLAKVIDFGIAKATRGSLTDRSALTRQHQMVGTPSYMSPEQALGSEDIDTRTDIYSLGALLYELLTDTTPFESSVIGQALTEDVQLIIREFEPPLPSARLAHSADSLGSAASKRRIEPRRLVETVSGELDWIVMKAIEKDRTRRYDTASALASDVHRYLSGQPVLAAPPSRWYRLRKFVRRHKGGVAAGVLVAASLLLGMLGFAWQARIALQRAAELEQVSTFQAAMLAQVDPSLAGQLLSQDVKAKFAKAREKGGAPRDVRDAEVEAFERQWRQVNATDAARALIDSTILKPAVAAIDRQFADQPIVDATLRQALADRYFGMGMYDAALPLMQQALATRRRVLGDDHPETLRSLNSLGFLLEESGKHAEAEPYLRECLERRRRVLGPEHPDTLVSVTNFGFLLEYQGKLVEAEQYFRLAMDTYRRLLGNTHPDTLSAINNYGLVLQYLTRLSDAEPYYREALAQRRLVLGEDHIDTAQSISNMGLLLRTQGKLAEAEPYYREAMAKLRHLRGEDHPDTMVIISNLGALLQAQDRFDEAEPYVRESLEKARRVMGEDHPYALMWTTSLGSLLVGQKRHAEAEAVLVPAEAQIRKGTSSGNAYRLAKFLTNLGRARTHLGRFEAASTNLDEAQRTFEKSPGRVVRDRRDCLVALVELYDAWHAAQPGKGHDAQAAKWREAVAAFDAAQTPKA